jgi:hypothetical protein
MVPRDDAPISWLTQVLTGAHRCFTISEGAMSRPVSGWSYE